MAESYEQRKKRETERLNEQARQGRDIGPIPPVKKPRRKKAAGCDFKKFCGSYFPDTFNLEWSDDHIKVIRQIEDSVLRGGLFATAMPRGSGKTSLAEVACEWAILYGYHPFLALLGSDEGHAGQMLDSVKTDFESNDLLLDDFPEAVYPIRMLEGIAHRCNGQLCCGERTHVDWTAGQIVMPTIKGSKASGAVIKVAGITGGLRGMKYKRLDGKTVRPSLVIIDDPQTDQSARSPSQCETRERILAGAILGLAGPGKKISGIMPLTVIKPGDMADNMLDRGKHPEWNGTRTKMVYSWPINEKHWQEYARLYAESLRAGHGGREATEYYAVNRVAMDEGFIVAWSARHNPDELSAQQHAMNLRLRDERAFFAEYQNEPLAEEEARSDDLTPDQVASKLNHMKRGAVPIAANRITAMIDVHASVLFYTVCAWEDLFTGYVIDYGAWPDQGVAYFTLSNAKHSFADIIKGAGLEGQITGALEALTTHLLTYSWEREDGASLKVERCLIDANWGPQTDTVKTFCMRSAHSVVVMPSHGKYFGASSVPIREWKKNQGDRVGLNWRISNDENKRGVRKVTFDTNFWKSFVHARLNTAMGDKGCLSLFGTKPDEHRMFADHVCAEHRIPVEARGRKVDEWKHRLSHADNHWWDCLVGCAVAASMQGVALPETQAASQAKPQRIRMSDLQRRKQMPPGQPRA